MKLRYFSDLHLEFMKSLSIEDFMKKISPGKDEVCILAGDIGNPYQPNYDTFIKFIISNFKKTFLIAGNHEYYNKTKTMKETNTFLHDYFQQFPTISFLNNTCEKYEGICFLGATLWSKITNPTNTINDVYRIPNFDIVQYNQLHTESIRFLEDALQSNAHEKCIVITHHMPSERLLDKKYTTKEMMPYNQWFCCNMDELITTYKASIQCWIYGHTHTPSTHILEEIPFVCNPIGYPGENSDVNFDTTITINL